MIGYESNKTMSLKSMIKNSQKSTPKYGIN